MDDSGAHFKKMGKAISLFLYLLGHADRTTGALARKVKTVASDMGVPRRTIFDWLSILRKAGYIETKNTGRELEIVISLWKTLWKTFHGVPEPTHLTGDAPDIRRGIPSTGNENFRICGKQKLNQEGANLTENSFDLDSSIDIDNINNLNIDYRYEFKGLTRSALKTKEGLLAYDLAKALNDFQGFPLYLTYARKYPEGFLRKILAMVLEIPPEKINKTRGALFNYLIQKHASSLTNHPGH